MSASPGSPGLILAPLAIVPAFESLAAERTTGIGPGSAHGMSTLRGRAPRRLAGLDPDIDAAIRIFDSELIANLFKNARHRNSSHNT